VDVKVDPINLKVINKQHQQQHPINEWRQSDSNNLQ
jgi:hypothetical protein